MLYPTVAHRDCEHCLKYDYNEETGKPVYHREELQKRHHAKPPLCKDPKKGCPKGSPEKPNTLSEKNREAYRHWRECKATGRFPEDEIVSLHADIIQGVVSRVEREQQQRDLAELIVELIKPG